MDSKCMEIAALGRPLYPGMLYDCRSDQFIPGVTLWDKKALRDDLDVHQQPKTHLKFAASDSLSAKADLLDISASLRASFCCGLVEVGGSAKYMNDTKSSASQCRVTMQYSQTTKFEQLTMKELGNITYPQVFEQKTATHVVTAVLYGAQAFMVFDQTASENESKQDVQGNLHAVINKIPTISIEGEASLKMSEEEKKLSENISVTFYGDYKLEINPTTYKEALDVFKMLPTLLKEGKNDGVPVTVWLYPLTLLDNRAATLMREISMSPVNKTEKILEELAEVERKCNDLVKSQTSDNFPDVKDRLVKFQELHVDYKIAFQKALCTVLPAIRSGKKESKALEDILSSHYRSLFTANNMNKWLDDITAELNILSSYTRGLKDLPVVTLGSLNSSLFDPDIDVVVCLAFTSLNYEDSYLTAVQDFMNSDLFANLGQIKAFSYQATKRWFTSLDISERMRENLSLFTSFFKANKNEKRIKFIIASISDPKNPGASIQLYQKGLLTDPTFQPVSKPPPPTVKISDEKIILELSKSPTGETAQFRIKYRTTPPTDSGADDDLWTVTKISDVQTVTLTGLKPADQYWVRYRAVSNVGVSEASDSVTFTFFQKINVKVDPSWDFSLTPPFNILRNKIMTNMGMSRWSLSTIKSEVTNVVNSPNIPYIDTIPGGLRAGMALYFQGVCVSSFEFNLLTGITADDKTAFHFSPNTLLLKLNYMIKGKSVCDTYNIYSGSAFDVFIVTKTEGYEVYVNGQKWRLFEHCIPIEKVASLKIHGDVIINIVGIVENWNTSTFGKELKSRRSRTKISNIQSDVPQPVCNPSKPYLGSIPRGLRPGVALFFQGVVPSDSERFEINLQTGPVHLHDIALHFKACIQSVVLNSCRNGTWGVQMIKLRVPFVRGGAFDIIMVIKREGYEVLVNGLHYCTFDHRIPLNKVTTLDIRGDVFMNTFKIIEAEDLNLNLKVTTPDNI